MCHKKMPRRNPNNYSYNSNYVLYKTTPISELSRADSNGLNKAVSILNDSVFTRDKVGSCLQCAKE